MENSCNHCNKANENSNSLEIFLTTLGVVLFGVGIFVNNSVLSIISYVLSYLLIGYEIFFNALKKVFKKDMFDENFLMTIATLGALITKNYIEGIAVLLLYKIGEFLQDKAVENSKRKIEKAIDIKAEYANLCVGDEVKTVSPSNVKIGDTLLIKTGEKVPLDGTIIFGDTTLDMSALTGESLPKEVSVNDNILSGSINVGGAIKIRVTKDYEGSTVYRIIELIQNASNRKSNTEKYISKFAKIYTPIVILLAVLIAIIFPLCFNITLKDSIFRALTFLVVSCPCALGLATPVAIMVGNGMGAKNGILFKTSESLEVTGSIDIIALDKTGTITKGTPVVTDVVPYKIEKEVLLNYAASLEKNSEHPLGKAITDYYQGNEEVKDFKILPGHGLRGLIHDKEVLGGSIKMMEKHIPDDVEIQAKNMAKEGKTPLFFSYDDYYLGMICVADTMKEDSPQAIKEMQNMGIQVVMLTGDNQETAQAIGSKAGVDEVIAGVLPDGKESIIRNLQKQGKVAMVGDGINDAPALTRADIGIAIGAGTDIAIDAADIVLMNSKLTDVTAAIRLSRATLRNIHENLFWAFFYNAICIPVAAGVFITLTGWQMNPMLGAAAMSLSSFFVCMNALRLNTFSMHDASKDIKRKKKEKKTMEKTLEITGMMCGHCEMAVKKALEAVDGVESADVSHEKGTAVVTLSKEVSNEVLKKTVEDKDYTVTSIKIE